jgi:hypothetical protein
MKTVTLILAVTLLAGALSTAALAVDAPAGADPTPATTTGNPPTSGPGLSGTTTPEQMAAQQSLTGTVATINQPAGELTITTEAGKRLVLSFPPSALTEYKVGDRVTVQLGLAKLPAATEATTSPEPSPGSGGSLPGKSGSLPTGSLGGPAKP